MRDRRHCCGWSVPLRRRGVVFRLLWLALANFCGVETHAEMLTIATYNVENYVATDRMTDNGFRKDYPKPEVQKRALRKAIKGLNADVLILQEMGTAGYLEELQRDLNSDGVAYAHAVLVVAADPDRHVALLSRRPILSVVQHAELEFEYFGAREKVKRGLLEAQFATSAGNLTIFGVHLKSRFTDRTDDPLSAKRRLGEATAIRGLISRRFPDPTHAQFVIVGDFNDDRSSKTLQRLTRLNRLHLSELLAATDSRGESWTHVYRKEDSYSRIDHVLMPASLAAWVPGGKARVFDGEGVLEASDHRPVIVTLEFPDKK